jgi:hypothetical protein
MSNCAILLNLGINMNTDALKLFHITTINKIKYVKYMMAKKINNKTTNFVEMILEF